MPALEPLRVRRVVAAPDALDRATWRGGDVVVLRVAPDEALGVGADGATVDDPDAIEVDERGLVGTRCRLDEIADHIDWPLPAARPALAQGKVAGVPAKLWLADDTGELMLVTQAAYSHTLAERLGWPR